MNPSHPIDSVYFPHLTFQEWFAAHYLVNCLYQSNKTKKHKKVRFILINEQLTPKYSVMIPFMAGILYSNIENGKDPSGSGLLYFWKLLHLSPPQLIPIYQMMFFLRCLDTCKADTESPFLSSQLRDCHKVLIHSFKLWLVAWINFDKNQFYDYEFYIFEKVYNKNFTDMMEMYSLTLQYVLVHPDIHSCVIDQLTQLKRKQLRYSPPDLFPCLYIFRKTSNIAVQYFELLLRRDEHYYCDNILKKSTKDQLDDAIKILINALSEKDIHESAARLLFYNESKLNEKQAKYIFPILRFNCGKHEDLCRKLLASIAVKLGGEYLEDVFNICLNIRTTFNFGYEFKILLIKMHEGERSEDVFQHLINGLDDPITDFRGLCARVLAEISMKLKEEHLNIALRCLSRRNLSMKLNEEKLQYSFQCLIDGLKDKNRSTREECAKMLVELSMKWNQ
ncbi:hypothetical protein RFI_38180, partial [Reticulomyxa filosa]